MTDKVWKATDVLTFGKYKGKTVQEVYKINPQYLLWCCNTLNWFRVTPQYYGKICKAGYGQRFHSGYPWGYAEDIVIGINGF